LLLLPPTGAALAARAPDGPLGKAGSAIRELAVAGDPEGFARARGFRLRTGGSGPEAELVVETAADAGFERDALERAGASVVQTGGSRAGAWVPLARLPAIAALPRVL